MKKEIIMMQLNELGFREGLSFPPETPALTKTYPRVLSLFFSNLKAVVLMYYLGENALKWPVATSCLDHITRSLKINRLNFRLLRISRIIRNNQTTTDDTLHETPCSMYDQESPSDITTGVKIYGYHTLTRKGELINQRSQVIQAHSCFGYD